MQALHEVLSEPRRSRRGERRDDDLVDTILLNRIERSRKRVGLCYLAVRVDPLAAQLGQGSLESPFRLRVLGLSRIALRRDDQEARSATGITLADSVEQRPSDHGLVCQHEDVLCTRLRRQVHDHVLDRNEPAVSRIRSTTFLRSQPDFWCGCVARMISSTGGSSCASASRTAVTGSLSTTKPCAGIPASRRSVRVPSSRLPAAARRVSS